MIYHKWTLPMLISKVTCPSVHATIEASKKQANNLYFLRRRYLCEKNWTEGTDCFLLGGGDVGRWGGNLQYVCSAGKCFDFVVFLLGSVTIYSTLSKSNLVLVNSQSSIFNIESRGSRQMTKINLNITRSSIPTGRRKTDQVAEHRTTKKPTL